MYFFLFLIFLGSIFKFLKVLGTLFNWAHFLKLRLKLNNATLIPYTLFWRKEEAVLNIKMFGLARDIS